MLAGIGCANEMGVRSDCVAFGRTGEETFACSTGRRLTGTIGFGLGGGGGGAAAGGSGFGAALSFGGSNTPDGLRSGCAAADGAVTGLNEGCFGSSWIVGGIFRPEAVRADGVAPSGLRLAKGVETPPVTGGFGEEETGALAGAGAGAGALTGRVGTTGAGLGAAAAHLRRGTPQVL